MNVANIDEDEVEDIKVALRLRPLNERELDPKLHKITGLRAWKAIPQQNSIVQLKRNQKLVSQEDRKLGRSLFTYDRVFDEDGTTEEVYDFVGKDLVSSAVEGRNGSIFAYGQTGSGKTHTMQGPGPFRKRASEDSRGIIHLLSHDLFKKIERTKDRAFIIQISVIEVYKEEIRDLLSQNPSKKLNIREDPSSGVFVNATKKDVNSFKKLMHYISAGEKNRVVARTTLNKKSSRSHIIFSINIESFAVDDSSSRRSNLNLIDLAGSESVRHRSVHSTERRRQEGGSINKSLLTLSLVIQALGAPRRLGHNRHNHVNYRDSKLTRVLQPSLSGNSRLAFICCVTTSGLYMEETKSTFQFAGRIKHVKTKSKVNVFDDESTRSQVEEELSEMKVAVAELEQKSSALELENKELSVALEKMTKERDEALKRVAILEKEIEALAVTVEKEPEMKGFGSLFGKNADRLKSTGISPNAVDRLDGQGGEAVYKKRQEIPPEVLHSESTTINGMPANIRVDSSRTSISDVTAATKYVARRRRPNAEIEPMPVPLPLLGLVDSQEYSA